MAGMRERLGGRLRPPSRLDGRRIRRLAGGDEGDIDDPVVPPKRGRYQLDMVNKLLSRVSLVHPPRLKSIACYRSPSPTGLKKSCLVT